MNVLLVVVFVLLSVAFYTLFERKVLSLAQCRVGPNKFGLWGVLQPLVDGMKLIMKEMVFVEGSKSWNLVVFPASMFTLMVMLWGLLPSYYNVSGPMGGFLLLLLMVGLMVFFIMLLAVTSSSKYATIGSMRSASQSVSYEISLSLILFVPFVLVSSLNFSSFYLLGLDLGVVSFVVWWLSCLMECNRAPFDFSEGESELISGFNVEYSSLGFVFIFLGEYGMMLFFSLITSLIFFKSLLSFVFLFTSLIVARASFPRYRYDLLMYMCWLVVLPPSVVVMFFSMCV